MTFRKILSQSAVTSTSLVYFPTPRLHVPQENTYAVHEVQNAANATAFTIWTQSMMWHFRLGYTMVWSINQRINRVIDLYRHFALVKSKMAVKTTFKFRFWLHVLHPISYYGAFCSIMGNFLRSYNYFLFSISAKIPTVSLALSWVSLFHFLLCVKS